ncbi:MAG: hypothetical protein A4E57_02984 [Syntrophorhabdaceae bacterium PtaU1.Bin034]|nr:MAG: hypothetical protein A4E57_02984 [Syntrophorhabdaceae bacterium PtaU1.Bin034]
MFLAPIKLLFLVFLIFCVLYIVRRVRGRGRDSHFESPGDILKRRYARGEISRQEFEKMKRDLKI